jgi:hypothetical protein
MLNELFMLLLVVTTFTLPFVSAIMRIRAIARRDQSRPSDAPPRVKITEQ